MAHTLLLADDSVTIQRVIELTFADEDIKVIAVSDGDQAIARIEAAPPDIVLADIGMPGKNGYEVARFVKRSPKLAKIPVLLLTGAFEPVDQARAAEAGCDGILAKPFEPQLVIARVKELLGSAPARPAERAAAAPGPPPSEMRAERGEPVPAERVRGAGAPGTKEDYFDRLDAAFTSAAAAPPPALVAASKLSRPPAGKPPEDIDVIKRPAPAPPVDLPLTAVAGAPHAEPAAPPKKPEPKKPEPETIEPTAAAADAAQTPPMPTEPVQTPSLADAFAALLAAERAEPLPPSVPTWPASGPPTDLIVDQVTRRVLAEMSDHVVRDTVTKLVSEIAERLIREEIEKIKATIK